MRGKSLIPRLCLFCASALLTLNTQANEKVEKKVETREISNDNSFSQGVKYWHLNRELTKRDKGGKIQTSTGGRSGMCLEVINPKGGRTHFYTSSLLRIVTKTDKIIISVYSKGKGAFRIGVYCYAADGKKFITTIMRIDSIKVNSEKWIKHAIVIDQDDFKYLIKKNITELKMRLAFQIEGESDLFFDDFYGILETIRKQ